MVFRSKLFLLSETEFRKYENKLEDIHRRKTIKQRY